MNFQPIGDRILAKVPEVATATQSGIFLPETATKERPTQAVIVAISESTKDMNIGDTVVYAKFAGTELAIDGIEYLVLDSKKDILGVFAK
ncbi:MAG: co-chaperone GroES [Arcobacteraceae bacterium]|nr:co-chaperone GroES [Arcobacteraceae bacterium]